MDCRTLGPQFCSSSSLLAFWVSLCILPVYELHSLYLGFFINIFAFAVLFGEKTMENGKKENWYFFKNKKKFFGLFFDVALAC